MKAVPLVERLRSSQQTAAEIIDAFFFSEGSPYWNWFKRNQTQTCTSQVCSRIRAAFTSHAAELSPSKSLVWAEHEINPNWCSLLNRLILNVQPILERGIKQNHMSGGPGCMNPPR